MIVRVEDIEHKILEKPRGGTGTAIQIPYDALKEYGGDITAFAMMDLEPDSSVGYHKHEDDMEVYLVLDGIADVIDDGEIEQLRPGDMLITPRGSSHSIINNTKNHLTFMALILK
jgi:mannose-6-phosphate isomerase-like protein (cupin superfamily)